MNTDEQAEVIQQRLDELLAKHAPQADHIYQQFLIALHTRGIASVDVIQDEVRARRGQIEDTNLDDPNRAERDRLDQIDLPTLHDVIRTHVCRHFTVAEVDDLVNLTLKREEVHVIEDLASLGNCTFRDLAAKVQAFGEMPQGETLLGPAEVMGTRAALIRTFVSDQLEFIGVAKKYLRIRDFADLTRRIVAPEAGFGKIGGKAGGMLLAGTILMSETPPAEAYLPIAMPDSYYLRSDVIEHFMRLNRLGEWQNQKYKAIEDVRREYKLIKGVFRNGAFPVEIVQQLRAVLKKVGNHPLIVRSSSLLEDRFGTAFSGKYASVFIANQGELESRLRVLLGAIAEVYASALAPDPISYRREHNLIDYQEDMAVLIQKVVGRRVGPYFVPVFAGVAFSRNEYRWSPRIRREDGLVRLVMGMGTRAVDRVGAEYPRMIALGEPTLRPESSAREIRAHAQRHVDVINLQTNKFESVTVGELLSSKDPFPMLDQVVSECRDDALYAPVTTQVDTDATRLCITFDKLLRSTNFAPHARHMLRRLEDAYGMPVDMEFACDGRRFYVLQCRPLAIADEAGAISIPDHVPAEDVLFDACRFVRTGLVTGVQYLVYVDPDAYDALPTRERRVNVARVIGRLNRTLPQRRFILIGPGRWGSNDLRLGVPVQYADINHARMLIEVARTRSGHAPEVSFGTHFFQDLVEANIHYLPLYPDEPGRRFNEDLLLRSPNDLKRVLEDDLECADVVRLIHVPAIADGRTVTVALDGETDQALGYVDGRGGG
ncbi:MAG: pyruvate, phosphate dikinase [Phycisphaerales bacterium]|nr:MAG: pyruvate, phosphate dikinase [Phycisphaerales bacterium]